MALALAPKTSGELVLYFTFVRELRAHGIQQPSSLPYYRRVEPDIAHGNGGKHARRAVRNSEHSNPEPNMNTNREVRTGKGELRQFVFAASG